MTCTWELLLTQHMQLSAKSNRHLQEAYAVKAVLVRTSSGWLLLFDTGFCLGAKI